MSASYRRSRFIEELEDIPAVVSAAQIYTGTKKISRFLDRGATIVESGVSGFYERISSREAVSKLDCKIADHLADWKRSHPIIMTSPTKTVERGRTRCRSFVHGGATYVTSTTAGKAFLFSLDVIIKLSEKVLDTIEPSDMRIKKTKSGRNRSTQVDRQETTEKQVQTVESSIQVHAKCQTRETCVNTVGTCQILGAKVKQNTNGETVGVYRIYRLVFITPLEFFVYCLKSVRRFFKTGKRSQKKKLLAKPSLTPEKEAEIRSRRKVSPRKRMPQSRIERIKNAALKMLGLSTLTPGVKQADIRQFFERSKEEKFVSSPTRSEDEKKRKYDDMQYDSESSEDDLSSIQRDLENYDSEEDPDYSPEEASDSDTAESSNEGDTESEIEVEEIDEGMLQIKDTNTKTQNVTNPEVKTGKKNTPKKDREGKNERNKSTDQREENKENTEGWKEVSRKPKHSKDRQKDESSVTTDTCKPARGPSNKEEISNSKDTCKPARGPPPKEETSTSKDTYKPARGPPHKDNQAESKSPLWTHSQENRIDSKPARARSHGSAPEKTENRTRTVSQEAEVNISGDVFQNINVKTATGKENKSSPARM